MLAKIKNDLKAAMKAKDTPRLNVLRAMITEYNNAAKTSTPIKTDIQLLSILKKRKAASEAAAAEAKQANRQDLEEKQMQEIKVMDEYAADVKLLPEDQIRQAVQQAVDAMKSGAAAFDLKPGLVLKDLFKTGGALDGKPVDKSQAVRLVSEILGQK